MVTTITKNSTKKLENKIFTLKESISLLEDRYDYVLFDYNVLTTPQKLMEYQSKYFENNLVIIDINEIKEMSIQKDQLKISDFNKKKINNE
jgi:hypothetical protein